MRAIEYEAMRQVEILEGGEIVKQETRLFDADLGETRTMRSKEDAHDYRYFPDPDLLPLTLERGIIDEIAASMPELPDRKILRYINEFSLSEYDANVLASDRFVADYFESAADGRNVKIVANWITSELFGLLNKHNITLDECKIKPHHINEMVSLIESDVISGKIAKTVFEVMFETGNEPEFIIKERGLTQVSDSSALKTVIHDVMSENPDSVNDYRAGKDKLFGFFVGQIMKKTDGKANPSLVNDLLKEALLPSGE
jgi:aspartyl-tRNA(Asn)/glutamyl-tRNA(Gln) amidotransferase subunit B